MNKRRRYKAKRKRAQRRRQYNVLGYYWPGLTLLPMSPEVQAALDAHQLFIETSRFSATIHRPEKVGTLAR